MTFDFPPGVNGYKSDTPVEAMQYKIQTKSKSTGTGKDGKPKWSPALCVTYIDARYVVEELNRIFGNFWSEEYRPVKINGVDGYECTITVHIPLTIEVNGHREFVRNGDGSIIMTTIRRTDAAQFSSTETLKAAFSNSLKRAAVHFGIGADVYELPIVQIEGAEYMPKLNTLQPAFDWIFRNYKQGKIKDEHILHITYEAMEHNGKKLPKAIRVWTYDYGRVQHCLYDSGIQVYNEDFKEEVENKLNNAKSKLVRETMALCNKQLKADGIDYLKHTVQVYLSDKAYVVLDFNNKPTYRYMTLEDYELYKSHIPSTAKTDKV